MTVKSEPQVPARTSGIFYMKTPALNSKTDNLNAVLSTVYNGSPGEIRTPVYGSKARNSRGTFFHRLLTHPRTPLLVHYTRRRPRPASSTGLRDSPG